MTTYPPRFGPVLWKIIHLNARRLDGMMKWDYDRLVGTVTSEFNYDNDRKVMHSFLEELATYIPCGSCATNYINFKKNNPVPSYTLVNGEPPKKDQFFNWSVDAHNHANQITGKRNVSYKEALKMFNDEWSDPIEENRIDQAQKMRLEDHFKIKELEDELKNANSTGGNISDPVNIGLLASLVVVSIVAIVLVILLVKKKK